MKTIVTVSLLALALALGGCASTATPASPDAPDVQKQADEQAALDSKWEKPMTGSRLNKRSTDRVVKSVGSQDARDALDRNARPLDANGSGG